MQIIRGTTPTIKINIKSDIDLSKVIQVWVYISQRNVCKVDKKIEDVEIVVADKQIKVRLSQEDTLALRAEEAMFQIRMLLDDETALATVASKVTVIEVYKGGVITEVVTNE